MKREPPTDDKTHLMLGALVRNVIARRRPSDPHPDVVRFPARLVARGRRRKFAWRWPAFGAVALALGLVASRYWFGPVLRYTVSGQHIHFSDGSDVNFSRDGQVRVLGVTARGAHLRLEGGTARIRVLGKLGTPRWSIEAGPYTLATAGVDLE